MDESGFSARRQGGTSRHDNLARRRHSAGIHGTGWRADRYASLQDRHGARTAVHDVDELARRLVPERHRLSHRQRDQVLLRLQHGPAHVHLRGAALSLRAVHRQRRVLRQEERSQLERHRRRAGLGPGADSLRAHQRLDETSRGHRLHRPLLLQRGQLFNRA